MRLTQNSESARVFRSESPSPPTPTDPTMPKQWPRTLGPRVGVAFGAALIGCLLVALAPAVRAYNDESPLQKWSPRYLFGASDLVGSRNPKSVYSAENSFAPRVSFNSLDFGLAAVRSDQWLSPLCCRAITIGSQSAQK